jgi:hypothetical protein
MFNDVKFLEVVKIVNLVFLKGMFDVFLDQEGYVVVLYFGGRLGYGFVGRTFLNLLELLVEFGFGPIEVVDQEDEFH